MDPHTITLGRRELASLMDLDAHFAAAEAAFRALAEGRASAPMPLHIALDEGGFHAKGATLVIPDAAAAATVRDPMTYVAVKVNSNFPGNGARGLPTIQGALLLYGGRDGRLLAIMDSAEITSRRTAAASALAARHLARPDSSTIAICGCGEQGRAQLAALARLFRFERAFAWDIDPACAERFARDMQRSLGFDVRVAPRPARADIVVTATSSRSAFLEDVGPGTFVAAIGADSPHKSEIHPNLMARAKVVADLASQAMAMGDLHHAPGVRAYAELGDIVAARKEGRTSPDEIIVFDSTGVAVQDVAAAACAYERAFAARDVGNA